jgi:hypothetical protein
VVVDITKYSYVTTALQYVTLPRERAAVDKLSIIAYFAVENGRVATASEVPCRFKNGQKRSEISKHLDFCTYHELKRLTIHIKYLCVFCDPHNKRVFSRSDINFIVFVLETEYFYEVRTWFVTFVT